MMLGALDEADAVGTIPPSRPVDPTRSERMFPPWVLEAGEEPLAVVAALRAAGAVVGCTILDGRPIPVPTEGGVLGLSKLEISLPKLASGFEVGAGVGLALATGLVIVLV